MIRLPLSVFTQPVIAADIGLFRTLFCTSVLLGHLLFLPFHLSFYAASIAAHLPLFGITLFAPYEWLGVLALAVIVAVSLTVAAAGYCTRVALWIATLSFFLFFKPIIDTLTLHHAQLPFFILLTLALAPGATALNWRQILRLQPLDSRDHRPIAQWPLTLPLVLLGISYFGASFWKIVDGGIGQFSGDVLRYHLAFYGLIRDADIPLLLAGLPLWVLGIASSGVILFQTTFLLALAFPRLRRYYVVTGIAFHTGIMLVFHIATFPLFYASAYFALLRWHTFQKFTDTVCHTALRVRHIVDRN